MSCSVVVVVAVVVAIYVAVAVAVAVVVVVVALVVEGSLANFRQYGQMKRRDGKSQRREEEKKEDQKRESLRRKKIHVRKKVGKSRNTVFFPMICGSGGSKSRLAKAAEPLWRKAHFEVKM